MGAANEQAIREAQRIAEVLREDARYNQLRFDANETNMLALQLEQMRARVYDQEMPPTKARVLLPVSTEFDPGADSYAYEEQFWVGEAKAISNYADDLPSVETTAQKVVHPFVSYGTSFSYSIQDMAAAAFSGKPLSARKGQAARRVFERELDRVAALGDPTWGIADGVCNRATGTADNQIRNTAVTEADWTKSTFDAEAVIADLNLAVETMVEVSEENYYPDTLVLPVGSYMLLSHERFTSDNPATVLETFLRSNEYIKRVEPWNRLKAVDTTTSRGLLLQATPDVLELCISREFTMEPPERRNLAWVVNGHGRTAGTSIYRPLGMHYLTGLPNDALA